MRKLINFSLITFFILLCITACFPEFPPLPMDLFTPEPVSLEILPLTKMEFYEDDHTVTIFDPITLVEVTEDPKIINQWNSILENNCQTYYPNHPRYEKTFNIISTSEDEDLKYIFRVDSDDNDIDIYPIRIEEDGEWKTIYELGKYRCEGMIEFLDQLSLLSP